MAGLHSYTPRPIKITLASRARAVEEPDVGVRMSKRIDKSWLVLTSIENFEHDRCVDLFSRPDDTYGFEEFRRDVEDRGEWTPVSYYSGSVYTSQKAALAGAVQTVMWLSEAIKNSPYAQRLLSRNSN
jgi:hypothetical protein